jgi:diguanylate cyclase (GGDEF)-like protein/PAS domain S-box-containing protein
MTDKPESTEMFAKEIERLRQRVTELEDIDRENERTKQDLRDALARLKAILDSIPDMAWLKDREGRFLAVNEAFVAAAGVSESDLVGKTDFDFWPHDAAKRFQRHDLEVMQSGLRKIIEEPRVRFEVERVWIETIKSPIYDHRKQIVGTTGITRNITRRKRALEALAESEAKYRELVQNARSIILRFDTSGTVTFFNEYAQSFFGYTEEEILGRNLLDAIIPVRDSAGTDLSKMVNGLVTNPDLYPSNENENLCRDGTRVWISWTNRGLYDQEGRLTEILSVGNDITRLKKAEDKLRELATTDSLTGLFNRRSFFESGKIEVERSGRYASPLSLMMLDLDHFKEVNDTYGHETGDQVLQMLADVMRNTLRQVDIIGRIGGEEFAVLLPGTTRAEARISAERLRARVEESGLEKGQQAVKFTVSIGLAEASKECRDLPSLLKRADEALYAAKDQGRNRVVTAGCSSS